MLGIIRFLFWCVLLFFVFWGIAIVGTVGFVFWGTFFEQSAWDRGQANNFLFNNGLQKFHVEDDASAKSICDTQLAYRLVRDPFIGGKSIKESDRVGYVCKIGEGRYKVIYDKK